MSVSLLLFIPEATEPGLERGHGRKKGRQPTFTVDEDFGPIAIGSQQDGFLVRFRVRDAWPFLDGFHELLSVVSDWASACSTP